MKKNYDLLGIGTMIWGYYCHGSQKLLNELGAVPGRHSAIRRPISDFEDVLKEVDSVQCPYSLGAVTNVIIANSQCGGKTRYVVRAPAVKEAGEFKAYMQKAGVNIRLIISDNIPLRKGITIVGPSKEAAHLIFTDGKSCPWQPAEVEEEISQASYFIMHASNLFQPPPSPEYQIFKLARKHNTQIVVDVAPPTSLNSGLLKTDLEKIIGMCDMLFGRESEFRALMGAFNSYLQQKYGLDKVNETGALIKSYDDFCRYCSIVIVTKGEGGSALSWRSKRSGKDIHQVDSFDQEANKVEQVINLSGAGDAYVGAFIAKLAKSGGQYSRENLKECAKFGSFAASTVISSGLPYLTTPITTKVIING